MTSYNRGAAERLLEIATKATNIVETDSAHLVQLAETIITLYDRLAALEGKLTSDLPEGWRLADHRENGRVIVTNTNPDRDGRVYYMLASENRFGYDCLFCYPEDLTYLGPEVNESE